MGRVEQREKTFEAGLMSGVATFARAESELEVELGADELLTLVQPSAPMMPSSAAVNADVNRLPAEQCCSRMAFSVGVAFALTVLTGLILYRPAVIAPPVPDVAMMIPESTNVSPSTAPDRARPPVRFANPFDRSEIFEFPAGTSRAEARRKVAQLLMERAHGRG
jgi:hypothetical protein